MSTGGIFIGGSIAAKIVPKLKDPVFMQSFLDVYKRQAMESPVSFQADAVRNEQAKVLHSVLPLNSDEVLQQSVRGQYGEGMIDGERVPGYRSESGVASESRTETFVALKLNIDNWRWAGVPFYLRTGKRMAQRHTEICLLYTSRCV